MLEFSYAYRSADRFYEKAANDGSIGNQLNIRLNGDTFINAPTAITGVDNSIKKYDVNTHYTVANVPAGLTLELRKVNTVNDNRIYIVFTGKADPHAKANSKNNVTITLKSAILKNKSDLSAVPSKTKNDIKIGFDEIVFRVTYVDTGSTKDNFVGFFEVAGYGAGRFSWKDYTTLSIGNAYENISIAVNKELIDKPVLGTHYRVGGLPANLILKLGLYNDKKGFIIWLNGKAVNHAKSDSTSFTVTFDKSIFKNPPTTNNDIIGRTQTFKLDFED